MNIVFLGTPDFAVPSLLKLINSRHKILAVVTQPDKPVGRGQKMAFSPVKEQAIKHDLKVLQYDKIRNSGVEDLKNLNPDIMITVAFGQILSKEILDIAKYGVINVHGSLLPKYRGAAPIQWAIINGEKKTGITIMQTAEGVDTGDVIFQKQLEILENETAGQLFDRMAKFAPSVLMEALEKIENGSAIFIKQNEAEATHFSMIKREDGLIDFSKNASQIVNKIKGLNPWPIAYFFYNGQMIKAYSAVVCDKTSDGYGKILEASAKNGLIISAVDTSVKFITLQKSGGKVLNAGEFLNGFSIEKGKKID